jgi:hypothetical protein
MGELLARFGVEEMSRNEMWGDVRCAVGKSDLLFSYVNCKVRVSKDHPLWPIRRIVNEALAALSGGIPGAVRQIRPTLDSA